MKRSREGVKGGKERGTDRKRMGQGARGKGQGARGKCKD